MDERQPSAASAKRRRQSSASLCVDLPWVLAGVIRRSQGTRLGPLVTPQTLGTGADGESRLASGKAELHDGLRFFELLGGQLGPDALAGLRVLDLGCGYGGRTIFYARECGAAHVDGIEPFDAIVARCRELADELGTQNVQFTQGAAEEIPFPDGSFDAVLSFDVIEHVQDPRLTFREIRRVLRTDGHGWLVFPTYLGARASHLDFITRVPGLHRIFDPDTVVSVVNAKLRDADGRYGVRELARPVTGALGHLTLPNLNGLTRREAIALMQEAGLAIEREHVWPCVRPTDPVPAARVVARLLARWEAARQLPEMLVGSLAYRVARA